MSVAVEAMRRIADPYWIEDEARGQPPNRRRPVRHVMAWPVFDDLEDCLEDQRARSSGKPPLAGAIRYGLACLKTLRRLDNFLLGKVVGEETMLLSEPDDFLTGPGSVISKRYKLRPHELSRLFVSILLKKHLQVAA